MNPNPSISIITDTTASLPRGWAQAHGVPLVPQVVVFGDDSYLEGRELTPEQFIALLKTSEELPKTQAPPPGECQRIYRRELRHAETLICIHPSSDVSGTVRSATIARADGFEDADIRIIDTRTIGGNLGSMVRSAVVWRDEGQTADEIMANLQEMALRARTYFMVDTLEYLRRGGRIGAASALLGSVLKVKPILTFDQGRVAPLEKIRTHTRAVSRLVELAAKECAEGPDAMPTVMHADASAEGAHLAALLAQALSVDDIPLVDLGAAITTHAGPGTLGVGFFAG